MTEFDNFSLLDPAKMMREISENELSVQDRLDAGVASNHVLVISNQLLNMHASPVVLVPAPGAGKYVKLISVSYNYVFGDVAYQSADGGTAIYYANNVDINHPIEDSLFSVIEGGTVSKLEEGSASLTFYSVSPEDQALVLASPISELTDGDGTLSITVIYVIVTL